MSSPTAKRLAETGSTWRPVEEIQDYGPGGLATKCKWRAAARRGGRASGVKRRQLARGRQTPHARTRAQALSLLHPIRQVTFADFERRYAAFCAQSGIPFDRRGLNTTYELYRVEMAAYRAQGQLFETTNGQRQGALSSRGRPRCRRTVQYTRKRLVAMGLVSYEHMRRGSVTAGRWVPGPRKDTLRVELLAPGRSRREANCTPPTGAGSRASSVLPAVPANDRNDLLPPPIGGRDDQPASPAATERERLEEAIRFQQLKLSIWGSAPQLHRLKTELRHLASDDPESHRPARRGLDARCSER